MKITYTCIVCKKEVTKIRTPMNMLVKPKYCSQKCHGLDKHKNKKGFTPNIEYHCLNCGKVVKTYRSPSNIKSYIPKFCSIKCLGIYQKGNKNPAWSGGKHLQNGYYVIFMPDHPYSDSKGFVYEHRLVAEQTIGRFLKPEEVVHHIDRNKINNDPNNLMVLKNQSEHNKLHRREDAK